MSSESNTAEYQRERRKRLAKQGYCRVCACQDEDRRPEPGKRSCHVCLQRRSDASKRETSMRRYLAARGVLPPTDQFCVDCQMHNGHRDGCRKVRAA